MTTPELPDPSINTRIRIAWASTLAFIGFVLFGILGIAVGGTIGALFGVPLQRTKAAVRSAVRSAFIHIGLSPEDRR